uniref:Ig-like domain-containing protein n=1 Tax=Neolamprologus brichardi TaxID=32507 RepID=A0A3Q4H053_NEOBR
VKIRPTVFPLITCGSQSGDMVTLGCLATGFNLPVVTFSWTKGSFLWSSSLTDTIHYPAVQKGNVYTGVTPQCISDLLKPPSSRALRSSGQRLLLVPCTRFKTRGDQGSSVVYNAV